MHDISIHDHTMTCYSHYMLFTWCFNSPAVLKRFATSPALWLLPWGGCGSGEDEARGQNGGGGLWRGGGGGGHDDVTPRLRAVTSPRCYATGPQLSRDNAPSLPAPLCACGPSHPSRPPASLSFPTIELPEAPARAAAPLPEVARFEPAGGKMAE